MQGVVVYYNREKAYGFIDSDEHEKNIFVHFSKIKNAKELSQGQAVEFQVKETAKGLSAVHVIAGAKQTSPYALFGLISAIIFASLFGILYFYQINTPIIDYIIALNITTFLLYGYDKMISSTDKLRVPEYNLHALALLGGSPAGLSAQKFFRHKTIKGSFQVVYWFIVLGQMGVVYWLY